MGNFVQHAQISLFRNYKISDDEYNYSEDEELDKIKYYADNIDKNTESIDFDDEGMEITFTNCKTIQIESSEYGSIQVKK
jgi:hypothetical protein